MTPTAGRQHRLWIIRSSLKPSSFAPAPHKRRDAANNFSKTRLCWRTGGGPSVIPPFSGGLDASHALAHSGHNQRRDFGSRRQRAFTAALRIAFRAPLTSERRRKSFPTRRGCQIGKCDRFPDHRKKDQCESTSQRFPRRPSCGQLSEDQTVPGMRDQQVKLPLFRNDIAPPT
jgi:hypothetical protein